MNRCKGFAAEGKRGRQERGKLARAQRQQAAAGAVFEGCAKLRRQPPHDDFDGLPF